MMIMIKRWCWWKGFMAAKDIIGPLAQSIKKKQFSCLLLTTSQLLLHAVASLAPTPVSHFQMFTLLVYFFWKVCPRAFWFKFLVIYFDAIDGNGGGGSDNIFFLPIFTDNLYFGDFTKISICWIWIIQNLLDSIRFSDFQIQTFS